MYTPEQYDALLVGKALLTLFVSPFNDVPVEQQSLHGLLSIVTEHSSDATSESRTDSLSGRFRQFNKQRVQRAECTNTVLSVLRCNCLRDTIVYHRPANCY